MTSFDQFEDAIRLGVFAGVFVIMALLELVIPRGQRTQSRSHRWFANIALVLVDVIALRIFVPVLAIGVAESVNSKGWGVLNALSLPTWLEITIAVIVLDLAIYAHHILFHKIPILWRVHKVHHADRDLDVTTGVRFHPIESVVSMLYKLICIVVLGPSVIGVVIFEVVLNGSSMFNHSNVKLPSSLDRILRMLVVTPDMHRVHHSIVTTETDSNYGFCLSIWDRLFGTHVPQPRDGHDGMTIGMADHQDSQPSSLVWSLKLPFARRRE